MALKVAEPLLALAQVASCLLCTLTLMLGQAAQGATAAIFEITIFVPALSSTLIESFPVGGVAVAPVAYCTHCAGDAQDVMGVMPDKHCPNIHEPPQAVHCACVVIGVEAAACQYDHLKTGVPPLTVKSPFVSLQTEIAGQLFTEMLVV